jgi:hypothetical protein
LGGEIGVRQHLAQFGQDRHVAAAQDRRVHGAGQHRQRFAHRHQALGDRLHQFRVGHAGRECSHGLVDRIAVTLLQRGDQRQPQARHRRQLRVVQQPPVRRHGGIVLLGFEQALGVAPQLRICDRHGGTTRGRAPEGRRGPVGCMASRPATKRRIG